MALAYYFVWRRDHEPEKKTQFRDRRRFDLDQEVHACLVEKSFPRLATVLSADECIEALKAN
jgi:hypothetical protein